MGGHKWGRGIAFGAIAGAAIGLAPFVAAGAQAAPIIVTITSSQQFDTEVLKRSEDRLMVAFFTTSWCSKCKKIDPSARDMAKKADGRWGLAIVDADDNEALADKYNVAALPTFLFFCQRQVHSRLVDEASPTVLQQQITKEEGWCSKAVQPIGGETAAATPTPTPTPTSKVNPVSTPAPTPEVTSTPTPTSAATPVPEVPPAPTPEPGTGEVVPIDPWWFG